jgi:hypothetical protein
MVSPMTRKRKRTRRVRFGREHPTRPLRAAAEEAGLPVSHPIALPPPWETYAPPFPVDTLVCVQTAHGPGAGPHRSPWLSLDHLPVRQVRWPRSRLPRLGKQTAVWIGDVEAAESNVTWKQLVALGDRQPVLISLGGFAEVVNRFRPRTVRARIREQTDRPTCARVKWAGFITRGFALEDVSPCGWVRGRNASYVVRHLVRSAVLRRFLDEHGLHTVLTLETDADATSDQPLCLYRRGRSGFLLVVDPGAESFCPGGSPASPYVARLVLQALGRLAPGRGQYTVSPRCRAELRQNLSGFCERFQRFRWHPTFSYASDPPIGWIDLRPPGGPLTVSGAPRRRIEARTGFAKDEWDLVFGVATYFKQLLREPVGERPGLADLLRHHSIQWIPVAARNALPPAGAKNEYTYLVPVPPRLRRADRPGAPRRADVRIDVMRGRDETVAVSARGVDPATFQRVRRGLSDIEHHLGARINVAPPAAGRGGSATWSAAFPVAPGGRSYDSIAATDRVVRVLDALIQGTSDTSVLVR